MQEPWTILELADLAAETLAAAQPTGPSADDGPLADDGPSADDGPLAGSARANGRIRDVPNERLIRWYVTVGLVDPPLSRRGRVAQYGRRHLLQLVAIKRRQAEGRSLAEIQAELAGATDEALAAVARIPDTRPAPDARSAAPARFWARQARQPSRPTAGIGQLDPVAAAGPVRRGAIAAERTERPAAAAAAGLGQPGAVAAAGPVQPGTTAAEWTGRPSASGERTGPAAAAAPRGGQEGRGGGMAPAGLVHGIRLAPGVTLLLEGAGREPGPDDVTGIVNAAQPLLEELASRRLRASGPGHPADVPGPSPGVGQLAEGSQT